MRNRSGIENPREYALSVIEDLRITLVAGAVARKDTHRAHFYEVDGENSSYYIHISPINGNVTLLAKWAREHQTALVEEISIGA
jgi:hypothetical protein